jgi:DNA-binding protein H-NS
MDISNLSSADLRSLQESIKQELKKREAQDLVNARNQIMAIAQSVGVSVKDLMGAVASVQSPALWRFNTVIRKTQPSNGRGAVVNRNGSKQLSMQARPWMHFECSR